MDTQSRAYTGSNEDKNIHNTNAGNVERTIFSRSVGRQIIVVSGGAFQEAEWEVGLG